MPPPAELEELAVSIRLELTRGSVAHTDRPRAAITFELQLNLVQPPLTLDSIHDLEILSAPRCAALNEVPEAVGFSIATNRGQRSNAEARIADPAVAVVPISAATRRLRK